MTALQSLHDRPRPYLEFLAGMRDTLALLLAVVPFGLIFGALALSAGLSPLAAQGFSLLVFAGSAQFIAVSLISSGSPGIIVVLTILVVNLRHALYSASISPHVQRLPLRWRLALGWLLTDEAFAVSSNRYRRSDIRSAHWYALGSGLTLWSSWQISTSAGVALGASIPEQLGFDFAIALTFLALLMPRLTDQPSLIAAISAGILAVLLAGLPFRLGLMLATIAAVGVALFSENRKKSPALSPGPEHG